MSNYFNCTVGLFEALKIGRSSQPVFAHITMGMQLAITVTIFIYGGYRLDTYYHKSPLFVALGACLGMGVGFYNLMRELKEITRQEKEKKEKAVKNGEEDNKRVKWM